MGISAVFSSHNRPNTQQDIAAPRLPAVKFPALPAERDTVTLSRTPEEKGEREAPGLYKAFLRARAGEKMFSDAWGGNEDSLLFIRSSPADRPAPEAEPAITEGQYEPETDELEENTAFRDARNYQKARWDTYNAVLRDVGINPYNGEDMRRLLTDAELNRKVEALYDQRLRMTPEVRDYKQKYAAL